MASILQVADANAAATALQGIHKQLIVKDDKRVKSGVDELALALRTEKASNLELISLFRTGVDDDWVEHFTETLMLDQLPKLTNLSLSFNSISDEGIKYLVRAFLAGKGRNLTFLNLSGNPISSYGIKHLATALEANELPSLTHLVLNNVMLGLAAPTVGKLSDGTRVWVGGGLKRLVTVFASGALSQLTHLSLCNNYINSEGVKEFARVLVRRYLPNLVHIVLAGNAIRDRGAHYLALAFAERIRRGGCARLDHVDLSSNKIKSQGAFHLVNVLKTEAVLNLNNNITRAANLYAKRKHYDRRFYTEEEWAKYQERYEEEVRQQHKDTMALAPGGYVGGKSGLTPRNWSGAAASAHRKRDAAANSQRRKQKRRERKHQKLVAFEKLYNELMAEARNAGGGAGDERPRKKQKEELWKSMIHFKPF